MVKPDPRRDYYADLDLPSSAEHEEIKKQFRLLAKLYHPDRNPGHEVEFVSKFQAVQAAHEILSDPAEKQKYDVARAKHIRNTVPPPPKAADDPYGFRRPARAATTPFPPPPQAKSKHRQYPQNAETPASAGAAKFNVFTRSANNQSWDRQRYEEAARAEAARGFSQMRTGPQPPEMPPRPPRPHPTAPRPVSSDVSNGVNPGFPGMSRTASARRNAYEEVPRSAYSHVHGTRGSHTPADHWTSPGLSRARTEASPLRHTKSSEPPETAQRPGLFDRQPSRYASSTGVKTDLNPGLGRSSSVRGSPVDPKWEEAESGSFGRPKSHPPPPRHRSASPNMRAASGSTAEYSESSSDDEADEPIHMAGRAKAQPRRPQARAPAHDGLDSQASFKNYTRVVHDDYVYPAPEPKQPTRAPFPNVTSPDDASEERTPFRYGLFRVSPNGPRVNGLPSWAVPSSVGITKTDFTSTAQSKPDPVFREAKFKNANWADSLRNSSNTSPSKKAARARARTTGTTNVSTDPVDVEMDDAEPPRPDTNGVGINDLNDLKEAGPFSSTGLNGVDDLKTSLPFESRASQSAKVERSTPSIRLRAEHLPRPPNEPMAPDAQTMSQDQWYDYCKKMRKYMFDWRLFERKMVEHFATRQNQIDESMLDEWIAISTDGPPAHDIDAGSGKKAGYRAYQQWLEDDKLCLNWWEAAKDRHAKSVLQLGRLRDVVKGQDEAA